MVDDSEYESQLRKIVKWPARIIVGGIIAAGAIVAWEYVVVDVIGSLVTKRKKADSRQPKADG